ncbi:HupE/UreJ family protein [Subsaximicrobium wynnwilliamsii]|uniref:HupE/UreJ family protein n=1 Tax=Subsaximicrobium wynnwilliamsii TaxID=291179 RepID=A0A5C6ZK03_9FLAO|nr:HupE/UreJ family protein [Subsaximicrobium wynnwilliamsii]TXD84957.1 HupE/UreJ family protein [Subsaximicrobium wynnwilliamsii]TXD90628.1 HupE/UreJ family protein [Subsaximicrobium wynnwilliamsii]TXE05102.1 HupE/UreJ family protein [Subsaximicrobium wynnwilliamsii]
MMDFTFYLKEGVNHILDFDALDHLYFIVSFCLIYTFQDWRKLLGLVTAFTVGHCLTLFLSGMQLVSIDADLVETLIPITILLSCLNNYWMLAKVNPQQQSVVVTYFILLAFGLIHGLGFSNYIKMMIFDDESVVLPLLGFNVGIEVAQLIIVALFLGVMALVHIKTNKLKWVRLAINTVIVVLVLQMIFF